MPIPSKIALSVMTALLTAPVLATAQDTSQPVDTLAPVVVTATRQAEALDKVKKPVAVVARRDLDARQPDSVVESLKYESNVEVTGGSRPGAQAPVIRGLSGNRILQVVDGVRQNTNSGHRGTYFVDPELVKQVEVVKGPSSSLWGSGALGGVVAMQTLNAQDLLRDGQSVGGYLRQGYHTGDDKTLTSGAVYGQQGNHDWLLNGYYHDNNDIRLGNGQALDNSASRQQGGMGKYGWQPDAAQRLQISARRSQSDQAAPSNPAAVVDTSNLLVQQYTRDFNTTIDYRLRPQDNPLLDTHLTAYLNRTHFDEYRISKAQTDLIEYQTLGFNGSNRAEMDWGSLLGGADVYVDKT